MCPRRIPVMLMAFLGSMGEPQRAPLFKLLLGAVLRCSLEPGFSFQTELAGKYSAIIKSHRTHIRSNGK